MIPFQDNHSDQQQFQTLEVEKFYAKHTVFTDVASHELIKIVSNKMFY